jgi:hypothetical protein
MSHVLLVPARPDCHHRPRSDPTHGFAPTCAAHPIKSPLSSCHRGQCRFCFPLLAAGTRDGSAACHSSASLCPTNGSSPLAESGVASTPASCAPSRAAFQPPRRPYRPCVHTGCRRSPQKPLLSTSSPTTASSRRTALTLLLQTPHIDVNLTDHSSTALDLRPDLSTPGALCRLPPLWLRLVSLLPL